MALLLPALEARLAAITPPFRVAMTAHYGEGSPDPSPAVCTRMCTLVLSWQTG